MWCRPLGLAVMGLFVTSVLVPQEADLLEPLRDNMRDSVGDLLDVETLVGIHEGRSVEEGGRGGEGPCQGGTTASTSYWDVDGDGQLIITDGIALLNRSVRPLLQHLFQGAPIPTTSPTAVVFGAINVTAGAPAPGSVEVFRMVQGQPVLAATVQVCDNQFAVALFPGTYQLETPQGHICDPNGDGQPDTIAIANFGDVVGPVELAVPQPPLQCLLLGGVVTCEGMPAAGATVVAWDANNCARNQQRTTTDAQGRYCFPNLPNGAYELHAWKRDGQCCGLCRGFHDANGDGNADPVNVAGQLVNANINMNVQPWEVVSVRVIAPAGGNPAGTVPVLGLGCNPQAPVAVSCWRADAAGNLEFPLPCEAPFGPLFFWKDNNGDGAISPGDFLGYLDLNGNGQPDIPGDCLTLNCQVQGVVRLVRVQ